MREITDCFTSAAAAAGTNNDALLIFDDEKKYLIENANMRVIVSEKVHDSKLLR